MNWRRFLRRKRRDADLQQELAAHLAHDAEDLVARGEDPAVADMLARRRLGNATSIRETVYDRSTVGWFEAFRRDIRYAARQLRLSPGFTVTAILTLALGIGANSAIFRLLDGIGLRSLPVRNPSELAELKIAGGNLGFGVSNGYNDATFPLWEQIRDHQQPFSGVFAWGADNLWYSGAGHEVRAIYLSGDTFRTLGVRPYRGRLFSNDDDRRGCGNAPGVVLSYAMWQREFAGDDRALGRKIVIDDQPLEIVGVTPPEFYGLEVGRGFDIAILNCSLALWGGILDNRAAWSVVVMGRLKPGWTLSRAAEYFRVSSPDWFRAVPATKYDPKSLETWFRFRLTAVPAGNGVSQLRETYEQSLWLLLGITGLVLVIACANLANLLLARAAAREREMAVRLALGASRARLIGQLLSESLLLAAGGTCLGALAAGLLSRAMLWFLAVGRQMLLLDLTPDWRVFAFTAGVAILTCMLFGLAPAIRASNGDIAGAIKSGGRSSTADRRQFSFQRFLLAAQIAVSLVLLVGAGLFVATFRNLMTADPGFKIDGLVFTWVNLRPLHPANGEIDPLKQAVLDKVRSLPGVSFVATSTNVPLSGNSWGFTVRIPGREGHAREGSQFTWISPGYFHTMQIPIVAGRDFNTHDTATSQKIVLVNRAFVRKFFDGADPIGRSIFSLAEPGYPQTQYEIVGLVADTKYRDLRDPMPPIAYAPDTQNPGAGPFLTVAARTADPENAGQVIQKTLQTAWPGLRIGYQATLRGILTAGLMRERILAWLSGAFGVLAVLIASIGLYGVVSYMTARRRNEIGIRLALGASRSGVAALVAKQTITPLLAGLLAGTFLTILLAGTAKSLLFGLTPSDPRAIAAAVLLLSAIALLASAVPAARAARLSPSSTLRQD